VENNTRPKMDISNRAKQFMPFSALKGLNEALEKVEQDMLLQAMQETADKPEAKSTKNKGAFC